MERLEGRALFAAYAPVNVHGLIAAINAANLTPAADTITLKAGATYSLTAADHTGTHGATGLPAITGTGGITLIGDGATLERHPGAATPAFRLFEVSSSAKLTLQDLTVRGGEALGNLFGGVVGKLVILPAQGGAIYSEGTLALNSVNLLDNSARGADASDFFGNSALGPGIATGGAVYSAGVTTVSDCKIQGNTSVGGRGVDGSPYVIVDPMGAPPQPPVPGSAGGAGYGGGLYVAGGRTTIATATISGNIARGGNAGAGYTLSGGSAGGSGGDGSGGGLYLAPAVAKL